MFCRKVSSVFLIVASLLLLAGCGVSSPAWALVWSPSNSALQTNSPQAAYAACAYAQRPDGTLLHPAESVWLATGSNPPLGLALSQLDATGQFFSVGVISIDPGSRWWTLTDTASTDRPAPGAGVPASQEEGKAWTLPPGSYNSASIDVPDTQPGGSVQLWVSDTGQVFVLARLYTTLALPTDHTAVTLSGQPGWLSTQGRFTLIALTLEHGIYGGLGTLLFASTAAPSRSQVLAAQAAAHLNDLLPS